VPALAKKNVRTESTAIEPNRLAALGDLAKGLQNTEAKKNPFLPVDPNLLIEQDYAEGYSLILNKYSVMKNHFMLVTRGNA